MHKKKNFRVILKHFPVEAAACQAYGKKRDDIVSIFLGGLVGLSILPQNIIYSKDSLIILHVHLHCRQVLPSSQLPLWINQGTLLHHRRSESDASFLPRCNQ